MNCRLLFYAAHKTSFCEKALQKSFSELDLEPQLTSFSTDVEMFGKQLEQAFASCDIVFVIGGLGFSDEKGMTNIISRAVADSNTDECKRLKNDDGDDGYVIRAQNQILVLLPDEPKQIEAIMQGSICGYIKNSTHK